MKKQTKKIIRALLVSLGLGLIHYVLHVSGWIYQAVGYGITIVLFVWLAFLEEKVFK